MKKILSLCLVSIMILLALSSCIFDTQSTPDAGDDGTTGEESKYDGTVYSSSVPVAVVKNMDAPSYVNVEYINIHSTLSSFGIDVKMLNDSVSQSSSEIAIGDTNRAASASAKELASKNYSEGYISYAIVYKDGVLAFYAMNEKSFSEGIDYLYDNYISSSSLTVDTSLSYTLCMSEEDYKQYLIEIEEQELLSNWDGRFDYLSEYLSDEAISELRYLYTLFDERVYLWVANLWDDEIGAFYYACSSRDYEGFYPDVESTCQALKIICGSGMTDRWGGGLASLDGALPEQMQEKILEFVFSLYSDEDGYFYHTQWGTDINDDRKGRDLTWSMQIVNNLGATLPEGWVDAVTRLKNQNSAVSSITDRSTVSAVSAVMDRSSVSAVASDNRFASKDNFIAYLNSLDILSNSYGKGHQLASQADQIKAAGLIDVCCDYLDRLQTQVYENQLALGMNPNGLWENETNYHAISGFFKLAVVYNSAGRSQQYLDRVLESCVWCILSDEEAIQVVYVYNPWAAIGECFGGMTRANAAAKAAGEKAPYDVEKYREEILFANAEQMFEKTYQKAIVFRKPDGGYSYNMETSAPTIQGVFASMGVAEGDMNATALLLYHMPGYMEGAFGFKLPDIWNINDYNKFLAEIDNLEYAPKKPGKTDVFNDFEGYGAGSAINDGTIVADGGTSLIVDNDPIENNLALKLTSIAGAASGFKAMTNMTAIKNCFVFEADLNMTSKSSGTSHQISFYAGGDRMYMLTLGGGTNSVTVGDSSNVKGTGVKNNIHASLPTEEWFNLRVELYQENETTLYAKIYIDGEYVTTSTNYFGSEVEGTEMKLGVMSYIWFYNLISPAAELYVDNLHMYYDDKVYSDANGNLTDSETYDFEKSNIKVGANMKSDGSYSKIEQVDEDAMGEYGNVYHVSKTGTNTWDQISFKMPTDKMTDTYLTCSMDFKFNSFDGTAQFAIGSLDPNAYYLMIIRSSGNSFKLSDASTMQSGYSSTTTSFDQSFTSGEWHNLRIELYVSESSKEFEANIYIDDNFVGKSKNFYNYNSTNGASPNLTLDQVNLRFTSATTVDMYIDNVTIAYE